MDALLMCGGRGTRLDRPVEKPLVEIGGQPMVEHVRSALDASEVADVYAAVSPHTPETADFLDGRCTVVSTPGDGYVEDLSAALDRLDQPLFTAAADLPLLDAAVVDCLLRERDRAGGLTVAVPVALKRELGVSVDTAHEGLAPAGVNVVDSGEDSVHTSYDVRLAVNVNREADLRVARRLHPDGETSKLDEREPAEDGS